MTEAALAEALALASSSTVESRCLAAQMLVGLLSEPQVEPVLLRLLLDAEDTSVTAAAADALLKKATPAALTIFSRGFASADADEDTVDEMASALYGDYPWPVIVKVVRDLTESRDTPLRAAAWELLRDLHHLRRV